MGRTSLIQWEAPRFYKSSRASAVVFTVNTSIDNQWVTTASPHGLTVGDLVVFVEDGGLPAPLVAGTIYSVFENASTNNFTITLNGADIVTFTTNGSAPNEYENYSVSTILTNFIVTADNAKNRAFWHESIINNHREIVNADKMHWQLEFRLQLFKTASVSTRRANFDELFGYLYSDVFVSRFNEDGVGSVVIRDSLGVPVTFVMDSFETSFLTQANYEDILTIGLKSKDPIDLSETF